MHNINSLVCKTGDVAPHRNQNKLSYPKKVLRTTDRNCNATSNERQNGECTEKFKAIDIFGQREATKLAINASAVFDSYTETVVNTNNN